MALPKLVKVTKPIHIPSLNKDVLFEPYTTEDEKSIVTLEPNASAYLKSLTQLNILKKCCQDETVDLDSLSVVEISYLFLKLRGISFSEIIELETHCKKCDTPTKISVNINDIKIDESSLKPLKLKVDTSDGIYYIIATQYTVDDLQYIDMDNVSFDSVALVLRQMMKSDGNDIIELSHDEKIELFSQLDLNDSKKLVDYISSSSKLNYHVEFECGNCGEKIEGDLQDFFI